MIICGDDGKKPPLYWNLCVASEPIAHGWYLAHLGHILWVVYCFGIRAELLAWNILSCSAGNQCILCLLFNSAQFHHYETAMTPLSETCDWAFSSALGHTLCKPSLRFSHHQYVWFGNKTKWREKQICAFIYLFLKHSSPLGLMIRTAICDWRCFFGDY